MSSAIFYNTYNGNPILEIWKVDKNGEKIGSYPIISFGLTKANTIIDHVDEILAWINTQ